MKIGRKLLPGQPGTSKLLDQYGEDLVCVRYRYDAEQKIRLETIEILVGRSSWVRTPKWIPAEKIVCIRIEYGEVELGKRVKVGGRWNREQKVWKIAYENVVTLGLEDRIVRTDRCGSIGDFLA